MTDDPRVQAIRQRLDEHDLRCQVCGRPFVNTAACCWNPKKQKYEPNRDPEE